MRTRAGPGLAYRARNSCLGPSARLGTAGHSAAAHREHSQGGQPAREGAASARASEALFQIIFRENGLVDRVGTWRESVFSYAREIRWAGSQPSYFPWKELNGPATVTNREKTLMYFRGRAIRLWPRCTTSWRVLVEKPSDGSGTYINAVGFAILDPSNPGKVLAAYEWNEDGQPYPMDAVRCKNAGGFPVRDLKIPDLGVRPFFRSDDVIEVKVTHEGHRIMATVAVNDDTMGEAEESARRQREFEERTQLFIQTLDVDEFFAQLLVSEGFTSIDEIAQSNPEDISKIDAIDEETAKELINRSKETMVKEKEAVSQKLKELGVEESLINLKGMTQGMLVILGQKNIKKLSDFADLSSDELIGGFDEIKGKKIRIEGYLEEFSLSRKEADELIMSAREIAYK